MSMMVLGSVITLIIISVILIGVSGRSNSFNLVQSETLFVKTEGCLEEALLQLSRNSEYAGNTYAVDFADCTVGVSGTGDVRTITVDAQEQDYYHHTIVDVQIAPTFAILNFSY